MFYEPYRKKEKTKGNRQRSRRRKPFGSWLAELCLRLVALLLALTILGAGVVYALPVSIFAVEPEGVELSLTDGLPTSRANILLLGLDAQHENSRRSDTVIIASIGYGTIKLTSVLRDTLVEIPGHGTGKLNAAYAYGGPQLVMRTLNENLGLNIMDYLAVDYAALIAAVDALGGVDVDLTEEEMEKINENIAVNQSRYEARGYSAQALTRSGEGIRLNGVQALTYARIRKLDSDFMRAGRQRALLSALLSRVRGQLWNPVALARLGGALIRSADTSMSVVELLSLGEKALAAGAPQQKRLPVDGSFTDDGSSLRVNDWQANIDAFRAFAYGD